MQDSGLFGVLQNYVDKNRYESVVVNNFPREGARKDFFDTHVGVVYLMKEANQETRYMMDITPKYPNAAIGKNLIGDNALGIVVAVSKALERVGASEEEVEQFAAEALSGNYDHVLQTTASWVGFKR